MKKIIFPIAIIALCATSCKKNRTCSCTFTETGPNGYNNVEKSTLTLKTTKKKAKTWCEAYNYSSSSGSYTDTRSCELL
jgi:hypothetical protein